MQVAFWSNYHQTGTTYGTAAVATVTALEYRLKTLVTHNHFRKSGLETTFLDRSYLRSTLTDFSDAGIDALSRFIKFNKVDKDNISNYTTTLLKKRLDLLIGTTSTNETLYYKDFNDAIDTILLSAQEYYDLIFIDVASGDNELASKLFEHSDLIVVNLSQNYNVLEDYFKNHSDKIGKSVFLIGRYDRSSRYNVKMLRRKYRLRDHDIATIPYNIEFADCCSEGRIVDFFMKNLKAGKDDVNFFFIQEVRKTAELILKKLEIDTALKKSGD